MKIRPTNVDWTKPTAVRLWETDGQVWMEYHHGPQEPMPRLIVEFEVDATAPRGFRRVGERLDYPHFY